MSAGRILWAVLSRPRLNGLAHTRGEHGGVPRVVALLLDVRVAGRPVGSGGRHGPWRLFNAFAALTLPPEYGVNPTARLVMGLQFAASAGEMSLPFVMGVFFQWERCAHPARPSLLPIPRSVLRSHRYGTARFASFGCLLLGTQIVSVVALLVFSCSSWEVRSARYWALT